MNYINLLGKYFDSEFTINFGVFIVLIFWEIVFKMSR